MNFLDAGDVEAIGIAILKCSAGHAFDLRKYAESQKAAYAKSMDDVATELTRDEIGPETARAAVKAFGQTQEEILRAIHGMKEAEKAIAINAGLGAIAGVINKAVGFGLLPV